MSNRPPIYGFCNAGCRRETVHKADFERSATYVEIGLDNGEAKVEPLHKYKINTNRTGSAYDCIVNVLLRDNGEYIEDDYSGELLYHREINIPLADAYDAYRNYFYFEVLDFSYVEDELYRLTYELNGKRKTYEFTETTDFSLVGVLVANAIALYRFNEDAETVARDGKDGIDGVTPHIGDNGNWFIGDIDTGVSAGGGVSSWNNLTDKPFDENADGTVKQLDNKYLEPFKFEAGFYKEFLPNTTGTNELNSTFGVFMLFCITDEATYNAFLANTEPVNVIYDGVEYVCKVLTMQGMVYIGNGAPLGAEGNGEPFAIYMIEEAGTYIWCIASTVDTSATEHTVGIYQSAPDKWLLKDEYLPSAAQPTSIDLSGFDTNGTIVETYVDGTSKTTTIEFDANGTPTKITDGDGNVTTLTW